jgi:hypothetical protein
MVNFIFLFWSVQHVSQLWMPVSETPCIQWVFKMLEQSSHVSCSHQNTETILYKHVSGNEWFQQSIPYKEKQSHYRPGQAPKVPGGWDPIFQDNRHMKVKRLSALRTRRLYPPANISGTHFCYRLSQPQSHSAAGRIMSMRNSTAIIGNRSRDLPACSAVPQPTAPPHTPRITANT